MKCPFCREKSTFVYNSRTTKFGTQIWRRRTCESCQQSFTTYEQPDLSFLKIKKPTGRIEPYSRAKLFSDIYAAFLNIRAKASTIDAVTDTIESKLLDIRTSELSSNDLVAVVLTTLKHFNTAAFVRFLASQSDLVSSSQLKKELKKY